MDGGISYNLQQVRLVRRYSSHELILTHDIFHKCSLFCPSYQEPLFVVVCKIGQIHMIRRQMMHEDDM